MLTLLIVYYWILQARHLDTDCCKGYMAANGNIYPIGRVQNAIYISTAPSNILRMEERTIVIIKRNIASNGH